MHEQTINLPIAFLTLAMGGALSSSAAYAQAPAKKPNIIVIMGDDVGWFNVGVYHQGIMSGKTPNQDKLAAEGTRFTDCYAEASCTAGRVNFITGEQPIRTGLTTVGQAGADVRIPAEAVTLATALKARGFTTGQFGKNHLGDLNKFLPTVHGFDEFFGYLYHLDGYNQLDLLLGKGPSACHEIFYFGGPHLGALRLDDFKFQFFQQPQGWPGAKVTTDMPTIVNIRQDPFERTPSISGETLNNLGGGYMNDFMAREFWRFVLVQKYVGELAKTAIEYPPMQAPASFNIQAVKEKVDEVIKAQAGQ